MVLLTRAQGLPAAPGHHGPGVGETAVFWALPEGPPPQLAPELHRATKGLCFLSFLSFLGPRLLHMEVPRLGVELEL